MINMGHCRFENTLAALLECRDSLAESCNPLGQLSEGEQKAARRLFALCLEIAGDYLPAGCVSPPTLRE